MTHTPGPWSYRSQLHDDWGTVRAGRYIICQARDPRVKEEDLPAHRAAKSDPFEANAHLIAAAPDLLEALESVRRNMRQNITGKEAREAWNRANSAIAKAKGETA